MLIWKWRCGYVFKLLFLLSLYTCPKVKLLDHMVVLFFSFETFSLTHVLFRNMLFNFQLFAVVCYWSLVWFHYDQSNALYGFSSFRFVEVCFRASMWSVLVNIPWVLRRLYFAVGWSVLWMAVRSVPSACFWEKVGWKDYLPLGPAETIVGRGVQFFIGGWLE